MVNQIRSDEYENNEQCFLMSNDISFILLNIFHERVNDVMSHELRSFVEKAGGRRGHRV